VPDHRVTLALVEAAGSPLMSTTLIPEDEEDPMNDAQAIFDRYGNQLAAVIDGGACTLAHTTVIDLSGPVPEVVRRGQGDLSALGLS
jgi:tRNA A37 threonylcarbamoyladenosine synthetase subunit TsaC/SUA5/YrdC